MSFSTLTDDFCFRSADYKLWHSLVKVVEIHCAAMNICIICNNQNHLKCEQQKLKSVF